MEQILNGRTPLLTLAIFSNVCQQCGMAPMYTENGRVHQYCSKKCARQAANNVSASTTSNQSPTRMTSDKCEGCGKYEKAVDANGAKYPYCSKSCAKKYKSQQKMCENCKARPCYVENGYTYTYCSKTCAGEHRSKQEMCLNCKRRPRNVENGYTHLYCSKYCATTASQPICSFPRCSNPASSNGVCMVHITRNNRNHPGPGSVPTSPIDAQDPRRVKSAYPDRRPLDMNSSQPTQRPSQRPRILFYDKNDPHYGFTNFSAHPVLYKGKIYPTSEHLFQSFKFQKHYPQLAEEIRTFSQSPRAVFNRARKNHQYVRSDWSNVRINKMDIALHNKFTQHEDLKAELLATGDAELVEDSPHDAFWGVGPDGTGRNELGKALERLRTRLAWASQ